MIGNCACGFDTDFGSSGTCDPQSPGINRTFVVLCADIVEAIVKTDCDATDPTKGLVTDITRTVGKMGYTFYGTDDSLLFESEESMNDNNGKDVNETLTGQGTVGNSELCWLRKYMGKEVVVVFEDVEGVLWVAGWDGGLKLNRFKSSMGQQQGDFKGVDFDFVNTKNLAFLKVIPDIANYPDNDAFMAALIVAAPV